jgi:hypothetical protein
MYYFHFLSYIQIVWVDMVEQTRKGMQVLIYQRENSWNSRK